MTVEINTITRVLRQDIRMSCNGRRHDYPRSIVTDHYLLDHVLDLRVEQEFFLGLVLLMMTKLGVHILPMAFPWT